VSLVKMQHRQILLLEDEAMFARLAKAVLEEAGYKVTVCHDGRQGLELALSEAYDLCLLNVMLPSLDGYGVAATLQQMERQLPLIFLTYCSKNEVRNHLAELGVTAGYLAKPFNPDSLVLAVDEGLGSEGILR
jgi:DNA-binding response OmpR family regulator